MTVTPQKLSEKDQSVEVKGAVWDVAGPTGEKNFPSWGILSI